MVFHNIINNFDDTKIIRTNRERYKCKNVKNLRNLKIIQEKEKVK